MNIEIDKLTPCLEKISTGKIVNTFYSRASENELKSLCGWNFKWYEIPQNKFEMFKETLIKSGAQIAQSDFSSDCIKISQAYLRMSRNFGAI